MFKTPTVQILNSEIYKKFDFYWQVPIQYAIGKSLIYYIQRPICGCLV